MTKLYAGLDVSVETTAICLVDAQGETVLETSIASTPAAIVSVLAPYRRGLSVVGLEAGSTSTWLHRELRRRRYPALCLDALKTRAALMGQRNKTDRTDAHDIAIALSRGFRSSAYVKTPEACRMRLLLTCRRTLLFRTRDIERTLRGALRPFGVSMTKRGETFTFAFPKRRGDAAVRETIETMMRARAEMLIEAKRLDAAMRAIAESDPICRRLMTVPGVGPVTAVTYRAAVDDPTRFAKSRLVGAYFGISPRRRQSGQSDLRGGISRMGDADVRASLYEAAASLLTQVKKPSQLKAWAQRLKDRKGFKVACTACARKLAVILHRMWVTGRDFDPTPQPR